MPPTLIETTEFKFYILFDIIDYYYYFPNKKGNLMNTEI